jgi:hypothetical protein
VRGSLSSRTNRPPTPSATRCRPMASNPCGAPPGGRPARDRRRRHRPHHSGRRVARHQRIRAVQEADPDHVCPRHFPHRPIGRGGPSRGSGAGSRRLRSVLRRVTRTGAQAAAASPAVAAAARPPLVVDDGRKTVTYFGKPLDLSRYEYRILKLLASRPGRVFSRNAIMGQV